MNSIITHGSVDSGDSHLASLQYVNNLKTERYNEETNVISVGYGEYVVFSRSADSSVDEKCFNQVYELLELSRYGREDRYEKIRQGVQVINSDLEVAFVPRTLYDLVLKRKTVEEDCCYGKKTCKTVLQLPDMLEIMQKAVESLPDREECWHLHAICGFQDQLRVCEIKALAYRVNQAIVDTLKPRGNFTTKELMAHTQHEIEILKASSDYISGERTVQIIKNAVELETSPFAKDHYFLYRGATFAQDLPYKQKMQSEEKEPYSMSYGSSLLAGCCYDPTASALHHTKKQYNNAFVIIIPRDQIDKSPFYAPRAHPIAQFFGKGETFHGRSKAWIGADIENLKGINIGMTPEDTKRHLISDFPQEELILQVKQYYDHAIMLA